MRVRRGINGLERTRALLLVAAVLVPLGCGSGTSGPTGSPTGTSAAASSPLVGAWVTSITKADLAAAGVTDPGLQNENSGRFIWTFEPDGSWTSVQESLDGSPLNNPVFRGTYTVDGSSLVAITEFPAEFRDAGLHYTFTLEGSSVRFDILDPPDPMLPAIVETHAWTRAS
jgi:hypothetical protein